MIREYMGSRSTPLKILTLILTVILIVPMILPIITAQAKPGAQWTIMIYMDADNNLDYYAYVNMDDMMTVGSTEDVNIIVLWDKYDDVANLYRVESGELSIVEGFALNGVETNMGDPDTLRDFVSYSTKHFRADNNALVLWDHGNDFEGCCWDDNPYDYLSHQEITDALSGFQIDILAFDACVEGMIEVAYEYVWADLNIDYLVATEGYVPNWGYPYDTILEDLASNPSMDALDLSMTIVDNYIAYYEALRPASRLVELAAIDMSYIDLIVDQLGQMTDVLENLLLDNRDAAHEMISEAKGEGNLGWSQYGWEAYIDLPTFVKYLANNDIHRAFELYDTLVESMYVKTSNALISAEGMGIFFPGSYGSFTNNDFWSGKDYLTMQFPHEGWWDFLQVYWGV